MSAGEVTVHWGDFNIFGKVNFGFSKNGAPNSGGESRDIRISSEAQPFTEFPQPGSFSRSRRNFELTLVISRTRFF